MNSKLMLLACSMLVPGVLLSAPDRKNKRKNVDKEVVAAKKTSDYDKLFQGKKHEIKKGWLPYTRWTIQRFISSFHFR